MYYWCRPGLPALLHWAGPSVRGRGGGSPGPCVARTRPSSLPKAVAKVRNVALVEAAQGPGHLVRTPEKVLEVGGNGHKHLVLGGNGARPCAHKAPQAPVLYPALGHIAQMAPGLDIHEPKLNKSRA